MSLVNLAYNPSLNWANPAVVELERHALLPIFGEFRLLKWEWRETKTFSFAESKPNRFTRNSSRRHSRIPRKDDDSQCDAGNLRLFVRSLVSGNSPYDPFDS
ncbi:MAG: hypothetical protein IPJ30_15220 [Acidobacteria bacterium]|nr:hypothetical protein [Acidobacteriota bacterium]